MVTQLPLKPWGNIDILQILILLTLFWSIPNVSPNYLDNTELIDIKVKYTNLQRTNTFLGKITQVKPVSDNFFVPDY